MYNPNQVVGQQNYGNQYVVSANDGIGTREEMYAACLTSTVFGCYGLCCMLCFCKTKFGKAGAYFGYGFNQVMSFFVSILILWTGKSVFVGVVELIVSVILAPLFIYLGWKYKNDANSSIMTNSIVPQGAAYVVSDPNAVAVQPLQQPMAVWGAPQQLPGYYPTNYQPYNSYQPNIYNNPNIQYMQPPAYPPSYSQDQNSLTSFSVDSNSALTNSNNSNNSSCPETTPLYSQQQQPQQQQQQQQQHHHHQHQHQQMQQQQLRQHQPQQPQPQQHQQQNFQYQHQPPNYQLHHHHQYHQQIQFPVYQQFQMPGSY